jgi:hypothetical protein
MPPAFFALFTFEIGYHLCPSSSLILLFVLPCVAGMTSMHHCAHWLRGVFMNILPWLVLNCYIHLYLPNIRVTCIRHMAYL